MFKLSPKFSALLVIMTALLLLCWQFFDAKVVLSEKFDTHSLQQPTIIATAPLPPSLVPAVLGGKPVYVLYVTRSQDTVLVRCYPGYEPTIALRAMGNNPNANKQKEGVMTCRPSA
ncbi:hypothetical protein [Calothrix sp. NIES-2098]|uniref:hypothetical protein n=1 Tax=Calothrix sp. NIES-2098 TaxID=1954171 RepID=UPI000B619417|nr:hypothetical protein NIES2098_44900 [Calothrix sp. NIES-2098]